MISLESLNETTAWLTSKVQVNWSTFARNHELYSKFRYSWSSEDLVPILLSQIRDMTASQFYWLIKIWKHSCYWEAYMCFTYQQICLKSENLRGHKADFCRQYCLMLVFKETWWILRSFFPLHKSKRLQKGWFVPLLLHTRLCIWRPSTVLVKKSVYYLSLQVFRGQKLFWKV